MSRFCIQCGAPLADDARSCSVCGTVQPAPEEQQTPGAQPVVSPQVSAQPAPAPVQQPDTPPAPSAPPVQPMQSYPVAQPKQPRMQYYAATPENVPGGGDAPGKKSHMGLGIAVVSVIAVVVIAAIVLGIIFIPKIIGSIDSASKGADTPEALLQKMGEYSSGDTWNKEALYDLCYECTYCRPEDRDKYRATIDSSFSDEQKKENEATYGAHYAVTFQLKETNTVVGDDRDDALYQLSKSFDGTDRITELMQVRTTMTLSGSQRTEDVDNSFGFVRIDGKWFYYFGG